MIYVRTQEGLYHNKINSTPFSIHAVTVKWALPGVISVVLLPSLPQRQGILQNAEHQMTLCSDWG